MKQTNKEKDPEQQKAQKKEEDNKNKKQPSQVAEEQRGLTKEDLPDSTNESTGQMGSGLRQDSN